MQYYDRRQTLAFVNGKTFDEQMTIVFAKGVHHHHFAHAIGFCLLALPA